MKNIVFLSFIFLLMLSCNEADDKLADCSSAVCTEVFVTLIVSVQDNSGLAIPLDRFEVLDKETDENLTIAFSDSDLRFSQLTGDYPLYNDSFVSENQNTQKTLIFKGFIDENVAVEAEYIVDTDCCHISLTSGDPIIIVN